MIIITHIILGVASLILSTGLLIAAFAGRAKAAPVLSHGTTATTLLTIATGIVLLVTSHDPSHAGLMLAVYTGVQALLFGLRHTVATRSAVYARR